jgi:flagellar motor protein MotB
VIDSGKSNGIRRSTGLALALVAGLGLGACSTMSDMGEATSEGVSKVADAVNPMNWFGHKDGDEAQPDSDVAQRAKQERAVATTATKTGMKSAPHDAPDERLATAADEEKYPKLSSVPDRPKDPTTKQAAKAREELREGLVADTANAQYTDKELRAQTTPAPQPADLSRSNERIPGETPARPAPTMPVSAAPVAPLPAASAPMQTAAMTPPAAPRVAPPPVTQARVPLAAASAAPVAPVAAPTRPTPMPRREASLAQPAPERPAPDRQESVLKTVQVATIYFRDGSTRLSANDRRLVDEIAEIVRKTGGTLRIIGHASVGVPARDPERADLVNYKVSLDRANSVATELARSGVPGTKMQVMAEGARNPIYAETRATGAAGNRRTEIYLDFYERL